MAKLAIKGHPTRGNEVIEIFEMLGGKNTTNLHGECDNMIYIINSSYYGEIIYMLYRTDGYVVFTLEEFLEKFPYKVGDKVTHLDYESPLEIVGMKWENDSIKYEVYTNDYGYWFSVDELQPYKEQETKKVSTEFFDKYCKKCGSQRCTAEGEWLEECKHYKEETMKELRIDFPEGYNYAGIENKQVIFTKIQPQYPKTCEECCKVVNASPYVALVYDKFDGETYSYDIDNLQIYENIRELLICRDAYWKIAGEQMGLGKPWEPDWDNEDKRKYVITCQGNHIVKDLYYIKNTILAFPTEEMRDAFYENFKELIESCKELL